MILTDVPSMTAWARRVWRSKAGRLSKEQKLLKKLEKSMSNWPSKSSFYQPQYYKSPKTGRAKPGCSKVQFSDTELSILGNLLLA